MKRAFHALVAAGAILAATGANATVINDTLTITASDFDFPAGSTAPDPARITFSITFDDSANISATTAGLTVHSTNLPYSVSFAYYSLIDELTLATFPSPSACGAGPNTFCVFIFGLATGTPVANFFDQVPANGSYYSARHVSIAPATVPEPAAWALMVGGFGLVGGAMRTRRNFVSFA